MLKRIVRRSLMSISQILISLQISGYVFGIKLLLKLYPKNRLTLSNSTNQRDGAGAQIQRILSVVAFCNAFAIKFTLRPITFIEDQISQNPLPEDEREKELKILDEWLRVRIGPWLSPQVDDAKVRRVYNLESLFFELLLNWFSTRFLSNDLHIETVDCYAFTQKDPDMYRRMKLELPESDTANSATKEIEIHVHMRFANFSKGSQRYLDPNYFFIALQEITSNLLQRNLTYKIFLHSDFSESVGGSEIAIRQISSQTLAHLGDLNLLGDGMTPNKDALNLAYQTEKNLVDSFENVHICKGEHFLTAINNMSQADYLVLSKSSFAFVAGVMNKSGVIYSPEYWNNSLPHWNTLSDEKYIS